MRRQTHVPPLNFFRYFLSENLGVLSYLRVTRKNKGKLSSLEILKRTKYNDFEPVHATGRNLSSDQYPTKSADDRGAIQSTVQSYE